MLDCTFVVQQAAHKQLPHETPVHGVLLRMAHGAGSRLFQLGDHAAYRAPHGAARSCRQEQLVRSASDLRALGGLGGHDEVACIACSTVPREETIEAMDGPALSIESCRSLGVAR